MLSPSQYLVRTPELSGNVVGDILGGQGPYDYHRESYLIWYQSVVDIDAHTITLTIGDQRLFFMKDFYEIVIPFHVLSQSQQAHSLRVTSPLRHYYYDRDRGCISYNKSDKPSRPALMEAALALGDADTGHRLIYLTDIPSGALSVHRQFLLDCIDKAYVEINATMAMRVGTSLGFIQQRQRLQHQLALRKDNLGHQLETLHRQQSLAERLYDKVEQQIVDPERPVTTQEQLKQAAYDVARSNSLFSYQQYAVGRDLTYDRTRGMATATTITIQAQAKSASNATGY
jgi:hypothetical protein